jgi:hypothetical protein
MLLDTAFRCHILWRHNFRRCSRQLRMTSLILQGLLCRHTFFVIISSINSQCHIPSHCVQTHKRQLAVRHLLQQEATAKICPPVSAVSASRSLLSNIFSNKYKVIEIVLAHFLTKSPLFFRGSSWFSSASVWKQICRVLQYEQLPTHKPNSQRCCDVSTTTFTQKHSW